VDYNGKISYKTSTVYDNDLLPTLLKYVCSLFCGIGLPKCLTSNCSSKTDALPVLLADKSVNSTPDRVTIFPDVAPAKFLPT
jgi:hypothetical protein